MPETCDEPGTGERLRSVRPSGLNVVLYLLECFIVRGLSNFSFVFIVDKVFRGCLINVCHFYLFYYGHREQPTAKSQSVSAGMANG